MHTGSFLIQLMDILNIHVNSSEGCSQRPFNGLCNGFEASPATNACGLFCLTCKRVFAVLQIGLTESQPLPWQMLWVLPDRTLSCTLAHSGEAELKI